MANFTVIALSVLTSVASLVLISLGLALIFGLMRIVNMAHGEFLMVGAFTVVSSVHHGVLPLWLAILVAPFISAGLGVLVELALIRPLYKKRLADTLLVTFGLSLVLFQLAVDVFGTTSPGIATPFGALKIGDYSVGVYSTVVLPIATLAIVGLLFFVFTRTRYGLLARATAQNPEMARALGAYAPRVNLITFAIGCGLAGLAGGLLAPTVAVSPALGQSYIAQAFMTVVTGGPAFVSGTIVSSALLATIGNVISQATTTLWGVTGLLITAMVLVRVLPMGLSASWRRKF